MRDKDEEEEEEEEKPSSAKVCQSCKAPCHTQPHRKQQKMKEVCLLCSGN